MEGRTEGPDRRYRSSGKGRRSRFEVLDGVEWEEVLRGKYQTQVRDSTAGGSGRVVVRNVTRDHQ